MDRLQARGNDAGSLPVEGDALAARRALQVAKLDSVESYATGTGCRRRALCGGCDSCDAERTAA